MSRKKKHKAQQSGGSVELNVMPFIDIFSLLCTFLLFSAVFVSIGIIEVQAPFLTNAAPSEPANKKPEEKIKDVTINIDLAKKEISLRSIETGEKEKTLSFRNDKSGVLEFHRELRKVKEKFPKAEKATLFTEEDVDYADLIMVLDAIKFYEFSPTKAGSHEPASAASADKPLFPKIIMGDIIL